MSESPSRAEIEEALIRDLQTVAHDTGYDVWCASVLTRLYGELVRRRTECERRAASRLPLQGCHCNWCEAMRRDAARAKAAAERPRAWSGGNGAG